MQFPAVLVFILLTITSGAMCSSGSICDVCNCHSNSFDTHSVTCDCEHSESKDIITTMQNMKELQHIQTFSVSHCESLKFEKNSFRDARDLVSVTILDVESVFFPLGVFSALTTLKIEDVRDLQFGTNAFMAAPILDIYIRNSHANEFPKGVFFAMREVRQFELTNITVNVVQREAISLTANQVLITQANLDYVDENAMNFVAESIEITHSKFENMKNNESLVAKSRKISIENNLFSEIPTGLFSFTEETSDYQISFTNNTVVEFSLQSPAAVLNNIDFSNNWFQLNCSSVDNVLAYNSSLEKDSESDQLLASNFWNNQCLSGLFIPLSATQNLTSCNETAVEDFMGSTCLGPMPTLRPRMKEAATQGPREGKAIWLDTTSTEKTMTQFLGQHWYSVDKEYSSSAAVRKEVAMIGLLLVIAVLVKS